MTNEELLKLEKEISIRKHEIPHLRLHRATCPHCGSQTKVQRGAYWTCHSCDLWFQDPLPPKLFEAPEEKDRDGRSGGHKQNPQHLASAAHLARAWSMNWIKKVTPLEGRPFKKALDIGCKYPYFAHVLRREFHIDAYGIDGMDYDTPNAEPIVSKYQQELQVPMLMVDFELVNPSLILANTQDGKPFDAISMIHVFEHMYEAGEALAKIHSLLRPEGYLLIRVPSHDGDKPELHLGPRHYAIHPYYYSEKSMRYLIEKTGLFELLETYPLAGASRDYILKPK